MIGRIERIIAKEGLILLGMAGAIYFTLSAVPEIIYSFPKYGLELTNGESYVVTIYPEITQRYNTKQSIDAALTPSPQLISKRVNEFIRDNKIQSAPKETRLINSWKVSFTRLIHNFFIINFFIKLLIIYIPLLLLRFILWAIRTLKGADMKKIKILVFGLVLTALFPRQGFCDRYINPAPSIPVNETIYFEDDVSNTGGSEAMSVVSISIIYLGVEEDGLKFKRVTHEWSAGKGAKDREKIITVKIRKNNQALLKVTPPPGRSEPVKLLITIVNDPEGIRVEELVDEPVEK